MPQKKSWQEFAPGDFIYDMHGMPDLDNKLPFTEPHWISNHIRFRCSIGMRFLQDHFEKVNGKRWNPFPKGLFILEDSTDMHGQVVLKAAYSYDANTFGIIEISFVEPVDDTK